MSLRFRPGLRLSLWTVPAPNRTKPSAVICALVTLLALTSARAAASTVCSIGELRQTADYRWPLRSVQARVDSAQLIIRVRAFAADSLAGTVTFRSLEVLRGPATPAAELTLPGRAVARDEFNPAPVPYRMVRGSGQRGDCFSEEYRLGGEYLLLLQLAGSGPTLYWWPLGPVNEQLRGPDDPWLQWVRSRVASSARPRDT